jgi:hypothetical protein
MVVTCPKCHEKARLSKLQQPFNFTFSSLFFGILGGAIGGLFWALGQENKYRCDQCEQIFFSHTNLSRLFFVLSILVYVLIAAGVCYVLMSRAS